MLLLIVHLVFEFFIYAHSRPVSNTIVSNSINEGSNQTIIRGIACCFASWFSLPVMFAYTLFAYVRDVHYYPVWLVAMTHCEKFLTNTIFILPDAGVRIRDSRQPLTAIPSRFARQRASRTGFPPLIKDFSLFNVIS